MFFILWVVIIDAVLQKPFIPRFTIYPELLLLVTIMAQIKLNLVGILRAFKVPLKFHTPQSRKDKPCNSWHSY